MSRDFLAELTAYGFTDPLGHSLENCQDLHDLLAMVPRWVPVTERLPEPGPVVLVAATWKVGGEVCVFTAFRSRFEPVWKELNGDRFERAGWRVSHWQPMPKPPQVLTPEPTP